MNIMEKRPFNTMKIKHQPSSVSEGFSNKNNYFKKLVREQGVSFLVGIAVGVNLILLLQMSDDIVNKLSETLTVSIIGIAAITTIIIVGVTIIYIQKKTEQRVKTLFKQQDKTIIDDKD